MGLTMEFEQHLSNSGRGMTNNTKNGLIKKEG